MAIPKLQFHGPSGKMNRALRWLGMVTTFGMFVVLVMGSAVTNTGSEQGCGRTWPLCHGRIIPQFAVATFIEFSHRAVVGVVTPLILLLAVGALYLYRGRKEIQILAPLMVVFLFMQAGLGAWAVMYPQESAILALHFGVSLISFASVLLTTAFILETGGDEDVRDRAFPGGFRILAWALTVYSYAVVYLGAYVRHAHADDSCSGWPLCNGSIAPAFSGPVAANFAHRLAALALILGVASLVAYSWRFRLRRPDLYRASCIALFMVILQAAAGALVVFTNLDLFAALAHAALAGALFGSLTYLCMHVQPRSRTTSAESIAHAFSRPTTVGR